MPSRHLRGPAPPALTELGSDLAVLEDQLRLALGLKEHRSLRMAALGDCPARDLPLSLGWGVARIDADGLMIDQEAPLRREPTTVSLLGLLGEPATSNEFSRIRATGRIDEDAALLVRGLLLDDRATFTRLVDLAPMIESAVYGIATRITTALDGMRAEILSACASDLPEAGSLALSYQTMVAALGRCTLLATNSGSPWLADLALSFDWDTWTPSFPLVRERSLWTTLIAARAASRFGPALVTRYLDALERARHPAVSLDALIGLTAIGLGHATERATISEALEEQLAGIDGRRSDPADVVVLGYVEARRLLAGGVAARALGSADRWRDGLGTDVSGRLNAFTLLPAAVTAPPSNLSSAARETAGPSSSAAKKVFLRAWGAGARRGGDRQWPVGNA